MLTEFHGEPVTGGNFPALIWKSFMKALKGEEAGGASPRQHHALRRAGEIVVRRGDRLMLDNGLCRERQEVVSYAPPAWARARRRTAWRTRFRCRMCAS